jgi:hypothetical protein
MAATDPTFYRSPGAAVAAAPEQLAYVAAFDPAGQQKDAIAVVDCDPSSPTYAGVVGWAPSCRRRATSYTTSGGAHARVRCATTGMAATTPTTTGSRSSVATCSSPAFAHRTHTSSTPSPTRATRR